MSREEEAAAPMVLSCPGKRRRLPVPGRGGGRPGAGPGIPARSGKAKKGYGKTHPFRHRQPLPNRPDRPSPIPTRQPLPNRPDRPAIAPHPSPDRPATRSRVRGPQAVRVFLFHKFSMSAPRAHAGGDRGAFNKSPCPAALYNAARCQRTILFFLFCPLSFFLLGLPFLYCFPFPSALHCARLAPGLLRR